MADLATAIVQDQWVVQPADADHPQAVVARRMRFTTTSMGTITNRIPGTVLGFSRMIGSGNWAIDGQDKVYPMSVSYDGTVLLVGGGASSATQDISDTGDVTVWGYLT